MATRRRNIIVYVIWAPFFGLLRALYCAMYASYAFYILAIEAVNVQSQKVLPGLKLNAGSLSLICSSVGLVLSCRKIIVRTQCPRSVLK